MRQRYRNRRIQVSHKDPLGIEPGSLMTGSKGLTHWTSKTECECNEIAGFPQGYPPSSWLCQLWSQTEDQQWVWNRDRRAVWDQMGLSHCRHNGLVMVQDEARLRRGHNDQSRRGHQYSETKRTGESRFHLSTPLGIEPGALMNRKQRADPLDQWDCV